METTIKNYKLKDFKKQPIETMMEYIHILQFTLPIETKQEVFKMKLKEVEEIKKGLNSADDDVLIHLVGMVEQLTRKEVLNLSITRFFGLFNSIKEQTEKIVEAEQNGLSPNYTNVKWEQVEGGKRLSKFGIYNTLDQLSNGDVMKYDEILELPYDVVFLKLRMEKIKADLQHEMEQIKSKVN